MRRLIGQEVGKETARIGGGDCEGGRLGFRGVGVAVQKTRSSVLPTIVSPSLIKDGIPRLVLA